MLHGDENRIGTEQPGARREIVLGAELPPNCAAARTGLVIPRPCLHIVIRPMKLRRPRLVTQRLLAAVAFAVALNAVAAPACKPNFLFIYTDDQRYDAMGVVQREQGDKAR